MAKDFKDLIEQTKGASGGGFNLGERRRKAELREKTELGREKETLDALKNLKEQIGLLKQQQAEQENDVKEWEAALAAASRDPEPDAQGREDQARVEVDMHSAQLEETNTELAKLTTRKENRQVKYQQQIGSRKAAGKASFESGVDVATSERSIASAIAKTADTPEARSAGITASREMGSPTLLAQKAQGETSIRDNSDTLRDLSTQLKTVKDPKERKQIEQQMVQSEKAVDVGVRQVAIAQQALKARKHAGQDEYDNRQKAETYMGRKFKEERLSANRELGRSGEAGSVKDLAKELKDSFEKLAAANTKLQESHDKGAEAFESAADEFKDAQEAYENVEQRSRGAAEGGWFGPDPGGAVVGAGQMASATGNIMMSTQVSNPLARMGMETGFAALENERYDTMKAGMAGDAKSLMKLGALGGNDQYAKSRAFATDIAGYAGNAEALGLTGDITQAAGSGIQHATSTGWRSGGVGTAGHVATQAAPLVGRADAMVQNLGVGNTYLRATQAFRARDDESQEVNYKLMQSGINRMKMGAESTRGFGGDRESIFNKIQDPEIAANLAAVGVDGAETSQALQIAKRTMGKDFGGDMSMLKRAGQTVQAGYAESTSDYMQQAGALQDFSAKAGGGEERLQQIMQAAITAGVDSSKHMRVMASGVMSLSAKDASQGIDTTIGSTMQLAKGTKTLTDLGMSASMAQNAALTSTKMISDLSKDRSTSFGNVMEANALHDAFGDRGVSEVEQGRMAEMTPEQLATLKAKFAAAEKAEKDVEGLSGREKSKAEAKAKELKDDALGVSLRMGVSSVESASDVDKISAATSTANLFNIMGISGTGSTSAAMDALGLDDRGGRKEGGAKYGTFEEWSKNDRKSAGDFATRVQQAGGDADVVYNTLAGGDEKEIAALKEKYGDVLTGKDGQAKETEKGLMSSGGVGAAKELSAAAGILAKAGSNFGEFNTAVNELTKSFQPEKLAESAERAAKTLGTAEEGLGTNIAELNTTIGKLSETVREFLGKNGGIGSGKTAGDSPKSGQALFDSKWGNLSKQVSGSSSKGGTKTTPTSKKK